MILAILIFCIVILLLSVNVHFYIVSENDTIKIVIKVGVFKFLVPHQRILDKIQRLSKTDKYYKKWTGKKNKYLILNIFSHSKINHIYIAKYSKLPIDMIPISNGLYYIFTGLLFGILHCRVRQVDIKDLRLQYVKNYENVDYYIDTHTDVISLIWVSIKSIFGGKNVTSN